MSQPFVSYVQPEQAVNWSEDLEELHEESSRTHAAGLTVLEEVHLGATLYPAFWAVKQRNRRRYGHLQGAALEAKVREDIARTRDSALGRLACRVEERLLARGLRPPFGIRVSTALERRPERA